ncbi:DUF1428 domain-containing protein [Candidatus Peribacteria bacterium]|nr:MAG: DUF1428 domain-containing protein [Candidatus Peribacteria bacterium]
MRYVDGYVFPLPTKNLAAYKKMAGEGGKMWMKHGALQYVECIGDDLTPEHSTMPFPKMAKAKDGETVVFSFIIYKSKAHRDRVNAKVMKEMESTYTEADAKNMPFDMKRIAVGGFSVLVDLMAK